MQLQTKTNSINYLQLDRRLWFIQVLDQEHNVTLSMKADLNII